MSWELPSYVTPFQPQNYTTLPPEKGLQVNLFRHEIGAGEAIILSLMVFATFAVVMD